MSNLTKIAIAMASVGTASGAGVAGYLYFSKDNFASKLGESVLNLTGAANEAAWTKRFEDLKKPLVELDTELTSIKSKTWKDLQSWCNNNKGSNFTNKNDKQYQRFEAYCTWKVGDKLTGHIADSISDTDEKWQKAHQKLKDKKREDLSSDLQKVFDAKASGNDHADKKAMHGWCTGAYKNIWQGKNDNRVSIVEEHCKDQ